jgi:hypothetical protein
VRHYMTGSGISAYSIGTSASGLMVRLGLFSNFLERMEREFSTTCIYALHSLMVSAAGSYRLCRVSEILVSSEMLDSTLLISPYR